VFVFLTAAATATPVFRFLCFLRFTFSPSYPCAYTQSAKNLLLVLPYIYTLLYAIYNNTHTPKKGRHDFLSLLLP